MILTSRAIYSPIEPPGELVRRKLAKYVDYGFNYYSGRDFKVGGGLGKGWDRIRSIVDLWSPIMTKYFE